MNKRASFYTSKYVVGAVTVSETCTVEFRPEKLEFGVKFGIQGSEAEFGVHRAGCPPSS